jgi:Antitoxin-like ribbon-helix-helix
MNRTKARPARLPEIAAGGAFEIETPGPVINRPKSTGPRAGKKAVPLWLPAAAKRQLDLLVIEEDTTKQALLSEAVNDLFKKYRKPPIA